MTVFSLQSPQSLAGFQEIAGSIQTLTYRVRICIHIIYIYIIIPIYIYTHTYIYMYTYIYVCIDVSSKAAGYVGYVVYETA